MNELRPLIDETPRARPIHFRPAQRLDLTIEQILGWADAFKARHGRWPTDKDKRVGLPDTSWAAINTCLREGWRGLNPGSSLAKLLLERRGRRHQHLLPPFTTSLILVWADAHHARTGEWPGRDSGAIVGVPGETWAGVEGALTKGRRGLPGGSSIAQLLAAQRGVRNFMALPPFTTEQILGWADAHHTRTGAWPRTDSGPIPEAPGETWKGVNEALAQGQRGLPGGSSLARLLHAERGTRHPGAVPRLEHWEILAWADAHHTRTGEWPNADSGAIPEAPGETWRAVQDALLVGARGLPGGDTVARLLSRRRGTRNKGALPALSTEQILTWADAHHTRTGKWPRTASGAISDAPGETWRGVNAALRLGLRGLVGDSSLQKLLDAERGADNLRAPPLTHEQILGWADTHHARTKQWPTINSGPVADAPSETWSGINSALTSGIRGLPRGGSLAQLLAEHRGVRNHMALPPFTIQQILAWADAHHTRSGEWPTVKSGPIVDAPGETWKAVDSALRAGARGLPGGDSLVRLLELHRGIQNPAAVPPLTRKQVLAWADAHHTRSGKWPTVKSGPIVDAPSETWSAVNAALETGHRGLPRGGSLARLLAAHRGVRNRMALPPFTVPQILAWADAHHTRTEKWPSLWSGPIPKAPGETWLAVDSALKSGRRGLPGGDSLSQFLGRHRGKRNRNALPPLTGEQILAWADAHHTRSGEWPTVKSGPIVDAPGETWKAVDSALRAGARGLPGGDSLVRLLELHRGIQTPTAVPPLTRKQVLAWADAHHTRSGKWPTAESGPIVDAPGETWNAVARALSMGRRGLPSGSTLAQLLAATRGVRNHLALPPFTHEQILAWADAHHARTGEWPGAHSGAIAVAAGETWAAVEAALVLGRRGLPGGSSVAQLLATRRGVRNRGALAPLTPEQILAWAAAHHTRSGKWPTRESGPITDASGETWSAVSAALTMGLRGLPGGSSLARLLQAQRGVRNHLAVPRLEPWEILVWADAHRDRTGKWPGKDSGPIPEAPGETWAAVQNALLKGTRGLPGGDSLTRLLARRRGK